MPPPAPSVRRAEALGEESEARLRYIKLGRGMRHSAVQIDEKKPALLIAVGYSASGHLKTQLNVTCAGWRLRPRKRPLLRVAEPFRATARAVRRNGDVCPMK